MKTLRIPASKQISSLASNKSVINDFQVLSTQTDITLEERVTLLLMRDLVRLGWRLKSNSTKSFEFVPPTSYEKKIVKEAMSYSRSEIIERNKLWIDNHLDFGKKNLASGDEVLESKIIPRIEVCETQEQNDLFRLFRYYWSSPSSDYVGRRIRLLIRDDGIKNSPVIGVAALGSSIIHIPDRDEWIGWDINTRKSRIIYMMDAYVLGAMPPYNYLLGGKLVSYILTSNEVRDLYMTKYANTETLIKKRKASDLALIMTTSLYGQNSSQYNRLVFGKRLLYKPIGTTSGYGTLHISGETFMAMRELAEANGFLISNKFGMGPNWRMRVIRSACEILGLNSETILKHSFQRGLFAIPLARNYKSFLNGKTEQLVYYNLPLKKITNYWRHRWLKMRKQNDLIVQKVKQFTPENFQI